MNTELECEEATEWRRKRAGYLMMANTVPLNELTATTIKLLCREIGVVNTARFINQFTTGHGNYTEERDQLFGDLTVDEIVTEIKRDRGSGKPRRRKGQTS